MESVIAVAGIAAQHDDLTLTEIHRRWGYPMSWLMRWSQDRDGNHWVEMLEPSKRTGAGWIANTYRVFEPDAP